MHQLQPDGKIPENVYRADFYSITRTDDELSIIAPARIPINSSKVEHGLFMYAIDRRI